MSFFIRTVCYCIILIALPAWAQADEQIDQESLEKLLTGNTVEGRKIKWDTTYRMYFDPSGRFRRIDSLNNKEGGEWRVESNGRLCMVGRKEHCRTIRQRKDGGLDAYNMQGQLVWTMDKVIPGNPYELSP